MRFFLGQPHDMGTVSALPWATFAELCAEVIERPVRLGLTRADFFALPKKDKSAPADQTRVKKVRYVTPAAFKTSPSERNYEHASKANLIALDIDDSGEARRLLTQRWDDCLQPYGFVVWRTISSTATDPRLRVLINAEGISRELYPAAVRTIAEMIGLTDVNSESRVLVQPMFLPTVFKDDPADYSSIVAINPDGDPFMPSDVIDADESSLVDQRPILPDDVADLDFLRNPVEHVSLADAESALAVIDPDVPMQAWIEIAAGLKHQFEPAGKEQEAYALWDAWSAKGQKYVDKEETRYRWKTLKAQPTDRMPVTIRSVFKLAQARGWENPTLAKRQHAEVMTWFKSGGRSAEELLDQGAKRIAKIGPMIGQLERKTLMVAFKERLGNFHITLPIADIRRAVHQLELDAAKTTGLLPWVKGLCYVTSLNVFYRHTTHRMFSPEVLDLMYTTLPIGEDKPLRPREYAIQIANVQQVENLRYDPSQTKRFFVENGVPFVNTYRPTYPKADPDMAEEAAEIFLDHMKKLIGEPEHRQTIMDFLAYMVQKPGKKIRWAPLIQGAEGCGKTSLAVVMQAVLGTRNVSKLHGRDVMNTNWNDWAYGHQLVVLEEIRVIGSNRHAVMDMLKPLITDDEISYAKKFEDHRSVPNITNYILFTNYHDSLAVREDGRRYFVLASPLQTAADVKAIGGEAHFDRLYRMIRDNAAGLRAFLEQWTISPSFNPEGRAPVTKYLIELADNTASPAAAAIRDVIEDTPHPLVQPDLLSFNVLRAAMDTTRVPECSDQALGGILREMGWFKWGRCYIGGEKHQLWTKGRTERDPRELAAARLEIL